MHMNGEATIAALLRDPSVLIASDGGAIDGPNGHPRSAGTFARLLVHYVRVTAPRGLVAALRNITRIPAQRGEPSGPESKVKGRYHPGLAASSTPLEPAYVGTPPTKN